MGSDRKLTFAGSFQFCGVAYSFTEPADKVLQVRRVREAENNLTLPPRWLQIMFSQTLPEKKYRTQNPRHPSREHPVL